VFDGGASSARSLLEAIATALITVTSLTFSLMVLVLQNAANRYSPRLLRKFVRDLRHQSVLAIFLGTFAFAVMVLPNIQDGAENGDEFVPRLAVTVALLLTIASIAGLVLLIYSITQSIRVEAIMRDVERDTLGTIERTAEQLGGTGGIDDPAPAPPPGALALRARSSGYLQSLDGSRMVEAARDADAVIVYRRTVGEQITEGAPLGMAWARTGTGELDARREDLEEALHDSIEVGYQRTLQEDVAFGLRQLTDIAVKALSTGINDPSTAVDAIGRLATVLRRLNEHALGAQLHADDDGTVRVGVPRPRFDDYLELVTHPIALYGGQDKTVVRQLLRTLEDLGTVVASEERRAAVRGAIDAVAVRAYDQMSLQRSIDTVERGAQHARAAVRGETPTEDVFLL
jgi:uncharacterized membrane protein